VLAYRDLSMMEKRMVANRMQQLKLAGLVRALYAGDYRMCVESWEIESRAQREEPSNPRPDTP